MSEFDTTIPLDAEVYAVVFRYRTDKGMSDIVMPEVAKTRHEALKHWRFNAGFLTKDEIRNTRVEKMTYRQWIELAHMERGMNPFHTICKMEFCREMGLTWRDNNMTGKGKIVKNGKWEENHERDSQ